MSKVIKSLSNRLPFAPVVAVLFAGTSAALMMATPIWLLEKWVGASGLSSIVSAAKAPLGMKARLALVIAVALIVGIITLVAMIPVGRMLSRRALSRSTGRRPFVTDAPVTPFRPDADAPQELANDPGRFMPTPADERFGFSRPPIFADRELGAPFMSDTAAVAEPAGAEAVVEAPVDYSPAVDVSAGEAPVAEGDVPFFTAPSFSPVTAPLQAPAYAPVVDHVEIPSVPVETPAPQDEPLDLDFAQIADIPEMDSPDPAAAPAPVAETAPVAAPVAHDWTLDVPVASYANTDVVEQPEGQPEHVNEAVSGDVTLDVMLDRFETGLRRRQLQNLVTASSLGTVTQAHGETASDAAADAALRDALGTLERLAANAR
jgi:hypothetical protein